jgi:RNA polymerase sigma-70 factor (ECF subfamily)
VTNIEEIRKGCIEGKHEAQEKLYKIFSGKMYAICLRYTGNSEDAQDVLQEGFIKIFQKMKQYNGTGSFEGWMKRIMVNNSLEKYRNKHHLHTVSSDDVEYIDHRDDNDVLDHISANDLMRLIQELTPQYRLVFNMYAIEGYSHKEIAEALSISEGTSKSNLSRARNILQHKIKKNFATSRKII